MTTKEIRKQFIEEYTHNEKPLHYSSCIEFTREYYIGKFTEWLHNKVCDGHLITSNTNIQQLIQEIQQL